MRTPAPARFTIRCPLTATFLGACVAIALAGCGPTGAGADPDGDDAAGAGQIRGSTQAVMVIPNLDAVRDLLLALPEAWNARDAAAWVASFGEESDFTNILGMHFADRAANEARHARLFETIFARSTLSAGVLSVRQVGQTGAVAELELTLVGYDRLPPGIEETEPGVLRTRLITVLERRGGAWEVVAAQNTAILPAAAAAAGG